ncbi:MAG: hypothetical protein HRF49_10945 [bacterium]
MLKIILIGLAACCLIASCSSANQNQVGQHELYDIPRQVGAMVSKPGEHFNSPLTFIAPVELEGFVACSFGKPGDNLKDPFVIKVEINFGDSHEWQDCTLVMQEAYRRGTPEGLTLPSHRYLIPGKYRVLARAVYWDGELVESGDKGAVVEILPPEDAGS